MPDYFSENQNTLSPAINEFLDPQPVQQLVLSTFLTSGRLQSMGSLGVGHGSVTSLSLFTFMHWRRKWQPIPVFLPGESQGGEAWLAAVYGVAQSRTRLNRVSSSSNLVGIKWFLIVVLISLALIELKHLFIS